MVETDETDLALFCAFADLCVDPSDVDALDALRALVAMPSMPSREHDERIALPFLRDLEAELVITGGGIDELAALVVAHRNLPVPIDVVGARQLVLGRIRDLFGRPGDAKRGRAWVTWLTKHVEDRVSLHVATDLWEHALRAHPSVEHRPWIAAVIAARRTVLAFQGDSDDLLHARDLLANPPADMLMDMTTDLQTLAHLGYPFLRGETLIQFVGLSIVQPPLVGTAGVFAASRLLPPTPRGWWDVMREAVVSLPPLARSVVAEFGPEWRGFATPVAGFNHPRAVPEAARDDA